jgi:PAS domain-containing protein
MFNDHLWHLRFTQAGGRLDYGLAYGVLAVGTIISLLVFGLFRSQLNAAERKREEQSLRQSERFVQATIDALSAQLCVLDESGRIIAVNRAWREFALANQGDLEKVCEGANYLAVCDAATDPAREDGGKIAEGIRSVMQGRLAEFDYEFSCHSSTRESWFFSRVTRFCASGLNRIVVTHENTTERRQAQEDLQQATERLSLAVRAGGVGIWDYDIANNRLVWADQMFRLYGIQRDQFGGAYDAWTAGR